MNKKKTVIIAVAVIAVISAVAAVILLSGGKKLDARDAITVTLSGVNGKGKANANFNYGMVQSLVADGGSEWSMFGPITNFESSVKVDVLPAENISNGDKVNVKLTYSKEAAKSLGIRFTHTDFSITADGWPDAQPLDPFEGLGVSFDGVSPNGSAKVDTANCADFTKQYVKFNFENNKLKNGDKLKITAEYNEQAADNAAIYITKTEQEYEISGLPELVDDIEGLNTDDLENALSDKVLAEVSKSRSNGLIFGMGFFAGCSFNVSSNCKLENLKVVERQMFVGKPESINTYGNILYTVYEITVKEENGNSQKLYLNTAVSDITKQSDGSISYNMGEPAGYNSLEAVHNKLNSIKDNYTSKGLPTDKVKIPQI